MSRTGTGNPGPAGRRGVFSPLKHRNFRRLWIGNLVSFIGDWLDQVALNWLMISLTGSPMMVAMVNLSRGVPMVLLGLIGGAVADRVDRRLMMIATQSAAMAVAILLAVAVAVLEDPVATVLVLALCRGIVIAFNLPARHSLVYELVPREDLAGAIVLNSITMNTAKILGPLASAGIIVAFGITACFAVNAVSFVFVLAMLFRIDIPRKARGSDAPEPLIRSVASGVRYIRSENVLMLLVLVALVPTFFCQPYLQFLTVFAAQVFQVGAEGLGLMTALAAAGSILGGVLAARLQRDAGTGKIMLGFMACYGLAIICFSLSPTVWVALPFLFATGAMHIAYNSMNNAALQLVVADGYRGRVLSMLFVTRGLMPLGTAAMAALTIVVGPRAAMGGMAAVVVIFAAALWIGAPRLRNLRL